jgi:60 kDa SS-A/Ro ribonucleoprotein
VSDRLRDEKEIRKARVFPYQLLTAFQNVNAELPMKIQTALQDAMEISVENVPVINGKVIVAPDVSGSMSSPVTGGRAHTTKTRCIDVAALVAASLLRKNPDTEIMPFDTQIHEVRLNPRDSIMTNAAILAKFGGGGTDCSLPLKRLNQRSTKADVVLYVSDNASWVDSGGFGPTKSATEWDKFKSRNKNAKLVLNDITPYTHTQVQERKDVYNVGGFSDSVFKFLTVVVGNKGETAHWVDLISKVSLEST